MFLNEDAAALTDLAEGIDSLQNMDKGVVQEYLEDMVPGLLNFAFEVVLAVLLYLIGRRVISFVRKLLRKSLERRDTDIGVRQFLDSVLKYCLYGLLFLIILTLFGITTASVVAVLGSAGLTIGLALQGSLANFAGGVLILLLKPFKVGDYIVAGDKEGVVNEISTFYTKIMTADNRTVMIPNGKLSDDAIVNVTGQDKRRIDLTVGVSYDADIKLAKDILSGLIDSEERRLDGEPVDVFVSALNDSSVDLGIHYWVGSQDYWQSRWDMLEAIKAEFDANGIEIPFRQLDVNLKK